MEGEALLSTTFPWDLFLALARDLPRGQRSLIDDCRDMVSRIRPAPVITGEDNIPLHGPVIVASNHYQRRGLWIGWSGALVTVTVHDRRTDTVPIHWLVTGGLRLRQSRGEGAEVPLSGFVFRAVARAYGMTSLPLSSSVQRATAVRAWLRALDRGEALGFFPEGLAGRSDGLRRPEPGVAHLARIFAALGVPVLPVAVFEEQRRLQARFGPPLWGASSDDTMQAIARLLPQSLRGPYREEVHGQVE